MGGVTGLEATSTAKAPLEDPRVDDETEGASKSGLEMKYKNGSLAEVIERIKTVKFFICGKVTPSSLVEAGGWDVVFTGLRAGIDSKFCAIAKLLTLSLRIPTSASIGNTRESSP